MLDLIQTEARLLHMLLCWTLSSSSDTLTIPRAGHWAESACPPRSYTCGLKRHLTHWLSIQLDLSYFPWQNSISQYSTSSFWWWSISFILHGSISQYSISDKRETLSRLCLFHVLVKINCLATLYLHLLALHERDTRWPLSLTRQISRYLGNQTNS